MAFGALGNTRSQQPVAEINMIPLIDVMLVLLVIFIIAAPLMNHAVKVELPKASSHPDDLKPEVVNVSINAEGQVFWNNQRVDATERQAQMQRAAAQSTPPELRIHADGQAAYRHVAGVMSEAARHRLTRIGFITEPE